jgi:lycopene cyclase domain-containing protein
MSTYLLINIAIISFPLLFSFEKNITFYKKYIPLLFSFFSAGLLYIIWDIIATLRGDWSFNPEFISGIHLFNLPVEELLFFVTVPYAVIFIYESLKYYLKEKNYSINKNIFLLLSLIFLFLTFLFSKNNYTFTVLLFTSLFFIAGYLLFPNLLQSKLFWITLIISYIPFLIVNYFLTSLPVVIYNPEAIIGYRVLTIPAEDFFYSFSMLSFFLLFYNLYNQLNIKWQRKKV